MPLNSLRKVLGVLENIENVENVGDKMCIEAMLPKP